MFKKLSCLDRFSQDIYICRLQQPIVVKDMQDILLRIETNSTEKCEPESTEEMLRQFFGCAPDLFPSKIVHYLLIPSWKVLTTKNWKFLNLLRIWSASRNKTFGHRGLITILWKDLIRYGNLYIQLLDTLVGSIFCSLPLTRHLMQNSRLRQNIYSVRGKSTSRCLL